MVSNGPVKFGIIIFSLEITLILKCYKSDNVHVIEAKQVELKYKIYNIFIWSMKYNVGKNMLTVCVCKPNINITNRIITDYYNPTQYKYEVRKTPLLFFIAYFCVRIPSKEEKQEFQVF